MESWLRTVDAVDNALPDNTLIRAGIGAGLGYMLAETIRPSFAYAENGQRREDAVLPGIFPGAHPPTMTPFWLMPLGMAWFLIMFF